MKINKLSRAVLISTAILFTTSSLVFAQENDAYDEPAPAVKETSDGPDEYTEASPETTEASEPDEYVKTELPQKDKKKAKQEWNPFKSMFESKQAKYIYYDEIKLSTGTISFNIKPRKAEVFVDPDTKKPGIQVFYQSLFFDFLFDEKNLALISEAYEKYLTDFSAHNLIKNKAMKTRKMYTAKGKCRTEWGSLKMMMNYYGDSQFHVGYEFKNNSPYFCIIIKECKNLAQDLGSNIPEKSCEVQLYFTKAEARQFLDSLSRETVLQKLSESNDYLELQSDSDY